MKITFLFPTTPDASDKLFEEIDLLENLIYCLEQNLSPMEQVNWVEKFSKDIKEEFDLIVATYSPYIAEAFHTLFPNAAYEYKIDDQFRIAESYWKEFADPMKKIMMWK